MFHKIPEFGEIVVLTLGNIFVKNLPKPKENYYRYL